MYIFQYYFIVYLAYLQESPYGKWIKKNNYDIDYTEMLEETYIKY